MAYALGYILARLLRYSRVALSVACGLDVQRFSNESDRGEKFGGFDAAGG
jgi:hypothetical protein